MPTTQDFDELTISHIPQDVISKLERIAAARHTTVEDLAREGLIQATQAVREETTPFDHKAWLADILEFRKKLAGRPSVLQPGETLKDLGRIGRRDA